MVVWELLEFHPLADLFPLMSDDELIEFADRIEVDGFDAAHPIVVYEGKILDGRNRWRCCKALNDEGRLKTAPPLVEFSGESALAFVLRENLHRRHLTPSQKAALAVEILPWEEAEARKRQGTRTDIGAKLPPSSAGKSREKAAKQLSVSPRYVSEAKSLKSDAPDLFQKVQTGEIDLQRAKKEVKKRQRPKTKAAPNLPPGTFSLVYADPPWEYRHCADDDDAIENQYTTLSTERICQLEVHGQPVQEKFAEDCVLFLWATSPKLAEAISVIEAWGFDYRTCGIWDKQKIIQGYYFRQQHELLLVAVKGHPGTPEPENRPPSVFHYARGRHSQKPNEVRELIEAMYPQHTKLELFCREPREGWTVWGNEVEEAAIEEAA